MSFLVPPEAFRETIIAAGLDVGHWTDKTELAKAAFAHMKEPAGPPKLPPLGVWMLVGEDIPTKAWNLRRNLHEERVTLIETVAVKPA